MQVTMRPGSVWATLRGTQHELFSVTEFVDRWADTLTPKGAARPVYLWRAPGELQLLGGVLALLVECEMLRGDMSGDFDPALLRAMADYLVDKDVVRDYQADAAVAALMAPFGRGLVEVAMGGGKTHISAAICALGVAIGFPRWLYLVQNKELAQQSAQSFEQIVPKMLEVLSECPNPTGIQVQRSSVSLDATTYAGVARLASKHYHGILVDECHLLPARTRCLPYASVSAAWRLGLSGTALDRQDGGNPLVVGLLGPSVFSITVDQLESRGFLSSGRVKSVIYDRNRGVYR